jgi:NADH-quinone oxidoreductase subunit J
VVDLIFYAAATLSVLAALGVVLARNPVHSVLWLLASFIGIATTYLLSGFQFLAAIQVLVYGGAIMVLFLFVVMLLNLGDPDAKHDAPVLQGGLTPRLGIGLGCIVAALTLLTIANANLVELPVDVVLPVGGLDPLKQLALQMFTKWTLAFEGASVLLLATAVGVMVLAKRERPAGAPQSRMAAKEEAA